MAGRIDAPLAPCRLARTVDFGESHLGDLNGDGHAISAWRNSRRIALVLLLGNDASGVHATTGANGCRRGIVRAVSGDINGDGRLDLVYSTTRGVSVQLGDGQGNFATPVLFAAAASGEVRLVDVNADGRLDVVVGSNGAPPAWSCC